MRCLHCFRSNSDARCARCGELSWLPATDTRVPDHDDGFLTALVSGGDASDTFELLCLALQQIEPPREGTAAQAAAAAMTDLNAAAQVMYAIFLGCRLHDESQAAACFSTARDHAERIDLGEARVTFEAALDGSHLAVRLHAQDSIHDLGVLDVESISWVDCNLAAAVDALVPSGWTAWREQLFSHCTLLRTMSASIGGCAVASASGFRERWKVFQSHLGEARDNLEPSPQQASLVQTLTTRERVSLRALDVAPTVSGLVESARNALRVRADALRESSSDSDLREVFEAIFFDSGLDALVCLREEMRREAVTAHAEMRKALDYQGRLLRTTQEALNASLSALAKRAGGLMWSFTPQAMFDEAIEQTALVLERAREVAMIEQGDAWLQSLGATLDEMLADMINEIVQRRAHLEAARQGYERLVRSLAIESMPAEVDPQEASGCRRLVRAMACSAEGVQAILARAGVERREVALV